MGVHSKIFAGDDPGRGGQDRRRHPADHRRLGAATRPASPARTAGYQRRADEWTLQANLAARELVQIGRQIIASLIAEQVAHHDYETVKTQVQQAQDVQAFLQDKFTSAAFYAWMQSDLSAPLLPVLPVRLRHRPPGRADDEAGADAAGAGPDTTFIQFNYWDAGHQGLLSGEALHLDIKRMEMAYHDNNKRELELTRHVSLRQLDPLALLSLRITGSVHGHRARVAVRPGLPRPLPAADQERQRVGAVGGRPLHQRQLHADPAEQHASGPRRCSPTASTPATRPQDDDRFTDYFGSHRRHRHQQRHRRQRDVRDQPARRAVPAVRGRRARSAPGTCPCPPQLPAFDYTTISDVILHIRYTARDGGRPAGRAGDQGARRRCSTRPARAARRCCSACATTSPPSGRRSSTAPADFAVTLEKQFFPYAVAERPEADGRRADALRRRRRRGRLGHPGDATSPHCRPG